MVFNNVKKNQGENSQNRPLKQTLVKVKATLGANCTIICEDTFGRYAISMAGAVVIKNIYDYALVVGNGGQ